MQSLLEDRGRKIVVQCDGNIISVRKPWRKITAYGTGELSVGKARKSRGHDFESTDLNKTEMVVHIHNPSVPMVTWDIETGDSPENWGTASLVEENKESIATMWKVRANIKDVPLTSTSTL